MNYLSNPVGNVGVVSHNAFPSTGGRILFNLLGVGLFVHPSQGMAALSLLTYWLQAQRYLIINQGGIDHPFHKGMTAL